MLNRLSVLLPILLCILSITGQIKEVRAETYLFGGDQNYPPFEWNNYQGHDKAKKGNILNNMTTSFITRDENGKIDKTRVPALEEIMKQQVDREIPRKRDL